MRNDFICKIVTDRYLGLLKEAFKTCLLYTSGQGIGRVHAVRAGGIPGIAHKDLAAQIGAGGQHHALCGVLAVELGNDCLLYTSQKL